MKPSTSISGHLGNGTIPFGIVLWVVMLVFTAPALAKSHGHRVIIDITENHYSVFVASDKPSCAQLGSGTHAPKTKDQCSGTRLYSSPGDSIELIVFYPKVAQDLQIELKEQARKSHLQRDISALLNQFLAPPGVDGPPGKRVVVHRQLYKRSYLNIKIKEQKGAKNEYDLNLNLGPREHWFLSVDMLISEADRLKYDSATSSLVERDIPSSFYLGINFMPWLDVYASEYSWKRALLLKALIKVSKHPLESAGIGLGYRLPEIHWGSKALGSTILFAAYMYDKQDILEGGVLKVDERYAQNWRFGISFGVDKLGSWIK